MSEPQTIEQKVTDIIRKIGIPAHFKGYYYVREAILLVIENDDFLRGVTTKLYPLIAENHNTTTSQVDRGIRTGIGAACRRGNIPFINQLFGQGVAERVITNKEFIVRIAAMLKNGY